MSYLSNELDRYLAVRRGLGYSMRTHERILRRFVEFADHQGVDHVGTDLFLRWQKAFGTANRETWAKRFSVIRIFSNWLHSTDPQHQVLPKGLIPNRSRRPKPYIYSDDEIRRIVEVAADLPSFNGIRSIVYPVLFGLIAVTGMRVSEALSLDSADVDFENGVVTIRNGKFGKARLLPLSASTLARLIAYAGERDRHLGCRPHPFFVSDRGERITDCSARRNFAAVCQKIGLRPAGNPRKHGRGPRIHDLRHSFAVHTLMNWYRTGKDPAREMIRLTTYLGHGNPADTYWYIEAVPELLELASGRATASLAKEVLS